MLSQELDIITRYTFRREVSRVITILDQSVSWCGPGVTVLCPKKFLLPGLPIIVDGWQKACLIFFFFFFFFF